MFDAKKILFVLFVGDLGWLKYQRPLSITSTKFDNSMDK